jgi:hypothetical protein
MSCSPNSGRNPVKTSFLRRVGTVLGTAALAAQLTIGSAQPAAAAAGDLIADVVIPERYPTNVAPSVAFDGSRLFYVEYGGSVLHGIDVPPAGATRAATGQVNTPIVGAPSGIMTLSYDAGRDAFWAVGGDGVSIYLLSKAGSATLVFKVDPINDRPQFQAGQYATEVKIAYDGTDDTIWYSPDATRRIYHYQTSADIFGTATLVSATPFVDVGLAPNDMTPQCGYNQSSGVAVGGAHLFISVAGCPYYFEYAKTGEKVAWYAYNLAPGFNTQDMECDDRSYAVPVFWIRDGFSGHIRAFEQPAADSCGFGGGAPTTPPAPAGFPIVESLTPSTFAIHSNSHAVRMPASVSDGDLLVCIFTNHGNPAVATPGGWTRIGTTLGGNAVRTSRYVRRADGTEGGATFDFATGTAETAVAHVYRITGWFDDGTLANAVQDAAATGTGMAPNPPTLDPASWDSERTLWIAAYGAQNLGGTTRYPTSYTDGQYHESGGIVGRSSAASTRRENAVASEDPGTFTNSYSQAWVAVTIGIRPRPAP